MGDIRVVSDQAPQSMDILLLLFKEGFVPIRVIGTNTISYKYIPSIESPKSPYTTLSAQQFVKFGYLASSPFNSSDILRYESPGDNPTLLYVEYGITPDQLEVFTEYSNTQLRTFSSFAWSSTQTEFGSVSGFQSKYNDVSSISGMMIMPKTDITFQLYNPTSTSVNWALRLALDYFTYAPINDAELVYNILNLTTHRKPKIYPVGNAVTPIKFSDIKQYISPGTKYVNYSSVTQSQIASDLGVS